jgi:chemotaxis protein CheX
MTTTRLALPVPDVVQLVDDITGAFLAARTVHSPTDAEPELRVTACVHLSGAFDGSVVLATSDGFATLCAGRMLAIDEVDLDEEAKADAVGEMTNMIGGSVKALMPEPSSLSLPVVSVGGAARLSFPGAAPLASVSLRCLDEPMRVTVLARGV